MSKLLLAASLLLAAGCGATGDPPIQGKQRGALCDSVEQPEAFACPAGTKKRGKPPPDGTEMWCERKEDGKRHGPYRRFPPGSSAAEPAFVGEGVVVGAYADDLQHGAWWTRRPGSPSVSVRYFEGGEVVQTIECRP